jgi:hypothetical protein
MSARAQIASIFLLLTLLVLGGCSGGGEKEETGSVDRLTTQVADEAVQNIREPMERAKQVQAIQDAHMKAVEKAVQEGQ